MGNRINTTDPHDTGWRLQLSAIIVSYRVTNGRNDKVQVVVFYGESPSPPSPQSPLTSRATARSGMLPLAWCRMATSLRGGT